MSLIQKLLGRTSGSVSAAKVTDTVLRAVEANRTLAPRGDTRALYDIYNTVPLIRRALDVISDSVGGVRWTLHRANGAAKREAQFATKSWAARDRVIKQANMERVEEHPLLDLFESPSARFDGFTTWKLITLSVDLTGEGFLLIDRAKSVPTGLLYVPAHYIQDVPVPERGTWKVSVRGAQLEIPEASALWLRTVDPGDPFGKRGSSWVGSMMDEVGVDEAAAQHMKGLFSNRALPPALVSVLGASREQLTAMKEAWHGEVKGGTALAFLNAEARVQQFQPDSLRDLQMAQLRDQQAEFLVSYLGVPPEMVGRLNSSNRSTIDASFAMLARYATEPRVERLRRGLQRWIVSDIDPSLVLGYEPLADEDFDRSLRAMAQVPSAYTVNELRSVSNHEPLPPDEGEKKLNEGGGAPAPGGFNVPNMPPVPPLDPEELTDEEKAVMRKYRVKAYMKRIWARLDADTEASIKAADQKARLKRARQESHAKQCLDAAEYQRKAEDAGGIVVKES